MHRIHSGLTVAAPLKDGASSDLKARLAMFQGPPGNVPANFSASDTTLFAAAVILPACADENLPETLLFTTTYWGPLSGHLQDLINTNRQFLCEILCCCRDYPAGLITNEDLCCFLKNHSASGAFNSRYNCLTKQDVKREKELRAKIEDYIDRVQTLVDINKLSALEIKSLIERHLTINAPEFDWAREPEKKRLIEFLSINQAKIVVNISILVISVLVFIVLYIAVRSNVIFEHFIAGLLSLAGIAWLLLQLFYYWITKNKYQTASRPLDSVVRNIAYSQLHPVINEMTATAPLKKGWLRRVFYFSALKFVNLMPSRFMDIPTVSNIRWLTIDNCRRLLFTSTYSNTTDFYVRDFLNRDTAIGVNFMFTNGVGFPDVEKLFYQGILKDPEGYMHAVHTGQVVTNLWYAHEQTLTSDNINKNHEIRAGLFKHMNEKEATKWLRLL